MQVWESGRDFIIHYFAYKCMVTTFTKAARTQGFGTHYWFVDASHCAYKQNNEKWPPSLMQNGKIADDKQWI